METLILLLASYGICFGLMNDKIKWVTFPLRKIPLLKREGRTWFDRMLICPYCTGFHTGWMVWLGASLPINGFGVPDFLGVLLFAFASSTFCYALDAVVQWFEG
jgi:hypothetical protein